MENYLSQFPSSLTIDNRLCRFTIIKQKEKWVVAYVTYDDCKHQIYRWNKSLLFTLKLMEGWLRQNGLWVEDFDNNFYPSII